MRSVVLTVLALLGLALVWLFLWPIPDVRNAAPPRPATSFEEAVARIRLDSERDGSDVSPACRGILFEHGHRTGRVVLIFHGITNCPAQFLELGTLLYRRGATVYVPRIPHHGLSDRMTTDLSRLTADEMAAFAVQQLDIARGLGDSVTVSGLSLGGVMAAWLAQERGDVDLAVPIAPLLGVGAAPSWLAPPITRLALLWPNQFLWWDAKRRERMEGPQHVYPRFSTRAIAEIMRLGAAVERRAARRPPAARAVSVVTVGGDPAVSNPAIADLVRAWRARAPGRIDAYEFPESLRLGHDLVDPDQPYQRIDSVYPVLADKLLGVR